MTTRELKIREATDFLQYTDELLNTEQVIVFRDPHIYKFYDKDIINKVKKSKIEKDSKDYVLLEDYKYLLEVHSKLKMQAVSIDSKWKTIVTGLLKEIAPTLFEIIVNSIKKKFNKH